MLVSSLLHKESYENLQHGNNLLAFSAGVDSTALFFILIEEDIDFDIAIVNYNTRVQSQDEVKYAKYLAQKYKKKCFVKSVTLKSSDFEKRARDERYSFFFQLCTQYKYDTI